MYVIQQVGQIYSAGCSSTRITYNHMDKALAQGDQTTQHSLNISGLRIQERIIYPMKKQYAHQLP